MIIAGFDIGGTKSEVAFIELDSDSFNIICRERISTQRQRPYSELINRLKNLFFETMESAGLSLGQVESIGVGMPGTIHPETGIMLNGNSSVFVGNAIAKDLQVAIGHKHNIYCENDANCFAYAEAKFGAGKDFPKLFEKQISLGIILGTGCGAGVTVYGNVLQGHHGGGGEVGHTELHTNGKACYCGGAGCAEQYLSGPALEGHFASRIYSQIEKRPGAREIFELYDKKDPIATAVVKSYLQDLEKFLGNLSNAFAPDYFVLGGGVSLQPAIYEHFTKREASNLFIKGYPLNVFQHKLGDSAGVIGAAILGYERR